MTLSRSVLNLNLTIEWGFLLTIKIKLPIIIFMKKYITIKNLGWLLTAIVVIMLGMSGVSKVVGTKEMVDNFTAMNMVPYMALVGVLEIVGVIALSIPRTSIYGALLISSIMSGAIAVHVSLMGGHGMMVPLFIGTIAWTSHCLRKFFN